jgi:THAP domain
MEFEVYVDNYVEIETEAIAIIDVSAPGTGCCVPQCANTRRKTVAAGKPVLYYRLPADPKRRNEWLKLIYRAQWTPQYHHRICSEHFVDG